MHPRSTKRTHPCLCAVLSRDGEFKATFLLKDTKMEVAGRAASSESSVASNCSEYSDAESDVSAQSWENQTDDEFGDSGDDIYDSV